MKKQKFLKKNFLNSQKGITLIALVITIIVLLILAGVALKLIAGGDGILGKAEKAVNLTNEAMAKEKLELKMVEYIADKTENPDLSVNEYLQRIEGCTEVVADESENNLGGYIVNIDGYEFKVSPKGEVLESLGKATSPQIKLELDNTKVTITITERGENIGSLEILDNTNQVIVSKTKEDMTLNKGKYTFNYTFTTEGTYFIKVTTSEEKEYTKQVIIDLTPPKTPVITSNYGYPVITESGIILDEGKMKIEYDTGEGIENYYSLDGTNWQEYTGEFQAQVGTVYARSVKKSNGTESTESKDVDVPSDAIPWDLCSLEGGRLEVGGGFTKNYYMNVDKSAVGKDFSIDFGTSLKSLYNNYLNVLFYDVSGKVIEETGQFHGADSYGELTTKVLEIPGGTEKICFRLFGSGATAYLYRVYLNN